MIKTDEAKLVLGGLHVHSRHYIFYMKVFDGCDRRCKPSHKFQSHGQSIYLEIASWRLPVLIWGSPLFSQPHQYSSRSWQGLSILSYSVILAINVQVLEETSYNIAPRIVEHDFVETHIRGRGDDRSGSQHCKLFIIQGVSFFVSVRIQNSYFSWELWIGNALIHMHLIVCKDNIMSV